MASEAIVLETRNRKTEAVEITSLANSAHHGSEEATPEYDVEGFRSTCADAEAMKRMGRNQQLVRHYRLFSMVSFIGMATASWERTLYQVTPALRDGGLPCLVYSNLWIFCAFTPVVLSLAEMASMAPIAGAQYHWVSEFAPEKYQRFLSYMTGYAANISTFYSLSATLVPKSLSGNANKVKTSWTSTLALQAGNASCAFLVGSLIQVMILVHKPDYSFDDWHTALLVIACVILTIFANIYCAKILPYWQTPIFVANIIAYFGFLIPVWCNAPKTTSTHVWTKWENSGGWSSLALAILVGQLPAITSQTGIDAAAHMSEEVRNASSSVPKVMIAVFGLNFVLNLLTVLTLTYHIPDITAALKDPTTYPAIWVLKQSMSNAWLTVLLTVQCVFLLFSNISYLAAVSRDLFAFARDEGLPFSAWLARVDKKRMIPTNAYIFSATFAGLLSLIYLGSPVAFYAIVSLLCTAIMQCFCFSISCMLWRRIYYPETLPHARFSLGRLGVPVNFMSVVVVVWSFFWSFWPQAYPVTIAGFNWAVAIFVPTFVVALIYYYTKGQFVYHGPVTLVEGRKTRAVL